MIATSISKDEPHKYKIELVPESVPEYSLSEAHLVLTKPLSNGTIVRNNNDATGKNLYKVTGRKIAIRNLEKPDMPKLQGEDVKLHDAIKRAQAARSDLAVAMLVVRDDMGIASEVEALKMVEASAKEQQEWFGMD